VDGALRSGVWVPYVSPAALYVQEGSQDPWFTREEAEALIAAAREPKHLVWYEAGHNLDDQSYRDRLDWLAETLGSDWKPGARRRRVCRNCGGDAASQPAPPLMSSIAQFAGACLQSRAHLPSVGVRALL